MDRGLYKKRNLKKKNKGPVATGKFSMETAKPYIAAALVFFHIVPLAFVFVPGGKDILLGVLCMTLNAPVTFGMAGVNAFKTGFNFKYPLLLTLISAASILMYYDGAGGISAEWTLPFAALMGIVYAVMAFLGGLLGGIVRRIMGEG